MNIVLDLITIHHVSKIKNTNISYEMRNKLSP